MARAIAVAWSFTLLLATPPGPTAARYRRREKKTRGAPFWFAEAARLHRTGASMWEVLGCYDAVLRSDPSHADAHHGRSISLSMLGAAPREALASVDAGAVPVLCR